MDKAQIINVTVSNPAQAFFAPSKSTKAECRILKCTRSTDCDLHTKGQCSCLKFFPDWCPHGSMTCEVGWTARAKKYYSWIRTHKEEYAAVLNKLKGPNNVLAVVGDWVYLPYSHMTRNRDLPFRSHANIISSGGPFLPKDQFTIDNIKAIIDFKPRGYNGRIIEDYQKEEIPKFLKHLQESMPKIFNELCTKYPEVKDKLNTWSHVGRKALLRTITKGVEVVQERTDRTEVWIWDGEYLTSTTAELFFAVVPYSDIEIKIKPEADATIKISDDNQVCSDTIFVD